jgi:hypothetical protein
MLDQKSDSIVTLRSQLRLFNQHLKEEQFLNNYCSEFVKGDGDSNPTSSPNRYKHRGDGLNNGISMNDTGIPSDKENTGTLISS